jgi:hypothetical protein
VSDSSDLFDVIVTPDGIVTRPLSEEERQEREDFFNQNALEEEQKRLAVEAQKQLARDVQTALTLLDGTATLAQMRIILARLIRYLLQQGVIDIG